MASIYSCTECGSNLNLYTVYLFAGFLLRSRQQGHTLVRRRRLHQVQVREREQKIRPFFETLDYWGIQRKRTKIKCHSCGRLVGYVYTMTALLSLIALGNFTLALARSSLGLPVAGCNSFWIAAAVGCSSFWIAVGAGCNSFWIVTTVDADVFSQNPSQTL
ncbi:hypothetical protein Acr_05g0016960 [Actinidia rufa]|uniref:Uncharacterized protein n=1 Tax=Actinidia rufa TaxID=165716 RepID=A0A7J0ER57_9ERIC|nr:hypothetical protein Acr_05g0016960 [Actinidia rufa]